jgi:hypothetical protein
VARFAFESLKAFDERSIADSMRSITDCAKNSDIRRATWRRARPNWRSSFLVVSARRRSSSSSRGRGTGSYGS